MERLLIATLTLVLAGCVSPKPVNVKSRTLLANTPAGSVLTLHEPLPVRARESRVALQFGQQVHETNLDRWQPYCEVITKTRLSHDKQIPQGDYRFKRVSRHTEPYTRLRKSSRHMLASAGGDLSTLYNGQDRTLLYKTSFHLESGDYSDVNKFVCGQLRTGNNGHRLSMFEFRQAVGNYLSIAATAARNQH